MTYATSGFHTVKKGDTLSGIAALYHINVNNLISNNKLHSSKIRPGQKILLAPVFDQNMGYIVRSGDSLYIIAKKFNTSIRLLQRDNNLKGSFIKPGQKLHISTQTSNNTSTPDSSHQQIQTLSYRIRQGDSLWKISRRFGLNTSLLQDYNGLASKTVLQPGQTILIPHRDSLSSIVANSAKHVRLKSRSVIVVDAQTGKTLFAKKASVVRPIASITKLMTAIVLLDEKQPLDEKISIGRDDIDRLKKTASRLPIGTTLSRYAMLQLALMSSENRAASALSRYYPGGEKTFIAAMNKKAASLGMTNTHFADATGLTPKNVSTAKDLVKLVNAASTYSLIQKFTTTQQHQLSINRKSAPLQYKNSNLLVQKGKWHIAISKTGYINEAGRCLVMLAEVANRPAVMIFLDSNGKYTPTGDANRVRKWVESGASGINLAAL